MRAILLSIVLCACGGIQQPEPLSDAIRSYNDGVRWERFEIAAVHIPVRERSKFVDDADERSKDIKITDYDIVKVEPRGDKEARVTVKLSWYKESEGTVHETRAVQTWEKHGKGWLLVDESRVKGPEMPGLPEPLAVGETPTKPDKD
ncbi:MAG: hypothetical protein JO257_32480 [Deltaproteobacteria bacterium]|nr:hypothetical protein [Deltaproteobacteria bacterium]